MMPMPNPSRHWLKLGCLISPWVIIIGMLSEGTLSEAVNYMCCGSGYPINYVVIAKLSRTPTFSWAGLTLISQFLTGWPTGYPSEYQNGYIWFVSQHVSSIVVHPPPFPHPYPNCGMLPTALLPRKTGSCKKKTISDYFEILSYMNPSDWNIW